MAFIQGFARIGYVFALNAIGIMIEKILELFRSSKNIKSPKLTTDGKIAVLVDQLRQLEISIFLEHVNNQYLRTRVLGGKPEYAKALEMSEKGQKEIERKRDWYREKLEELKRK